MEDAPLQEVQRPTPVGSLLSTRCSGARACSTAVPQQTLCQGGR